MKTHKVTVTTTKTKRQSRKGASLDPSDEAPTSFPTQDELPTMETPKIPKLEEKGRLLVNRRDRAKKLTSEAAELEDECAIIMQDYAIEEYNKNGVHLKINRKRSIKAELD